MWHNFRWRYKLGLQASAVIMMLTNNAMNVCLWRENFAGILFYASALVHVMCEQIILVWVDGFICWELLLAISCSTRQKTNKRKKTMANNSQTKFSRHSMISEIIIGKRISKESQERKQFMGTPQRCKRGEDLSGNYKRQHKTLNPNYHNLQLSSFFYLFSTTLWGRIERYVFLHHKESGFLFSKPPRTTAAGVSARHSN